MRMVQSLLQQRSQPQSLVVRRDSKAIRGVGRLIERKREVDMLWLEDFGKAKLKMG